MSFVVPNLANNITRCIFREREIETAISDLPNMIEYNTGQSVLNRQFNFDQWTLCITEDRQRANFRMNT